MTEAQFARALALAATRDFIPGVVSTRVERVAAIQQIVDGADRKQAETVLAKLRLAPWATPRWRERTRRFRHDHANQVRALRGEAPVPWRPAPYAPVVTRYGPLTEHDSRLYDTMVYGWRRTRPTRAELAAWYSACVVRHDPDWGPILVATPD